MLRVETEFNEREREIARYFDFLRRFGDGQVEVDLPAAPAPAVPFETDELFKTLKANGFLLLYNLVESTTKNAIEAIFEEFKLKEVSFDQCRVEVRKVILRNLKKHDVGKIVSLLSVLSTDVMVTTFRKEELAGGNVDGRFVRTLAGWYGFSSPQAKSDELLTVKTNRNDLAHGLKSFSEVGRDFDLARLEQIRSEVVGFLRALLACVSDYLSKRTYLATR